VPPRVAHRICRPILSTTETCCNRTRRTSTSRAALRERIVPGAASVSVCMVSSRGRYLTHRLGGRNLGEKPPRRSVMSRRKPTHTNALTCTFEHMSWSRTYPYLIRDEEAVGSNPATPTPENAAQGRFPVTGHRP
jgi:hypothetical protein